MNSGNTRVNASPLYASDGDNNTIIGSNSGSTYINHEGNNILFGAEVSGVANEMGVIRIGNMSGSSIQTTCYIAGIAGNSVSNQQVVTIDTSNGQMGSVNLSFLTGLYSSITSPTSTITTTETIIVGGSSAPVIAAGSLKAGDSYLIRLQGSCSSLLGGTSTFKLRMGTAGSVSDGVIWSAPITAATLGTTVNFVAEIVITIKTVGASATLGGYMSIINTGLVGLIPTASAVVVGTPSTFSSNTNNYLSATFVTSVGSLSAAFTIATIEKL